MKVYPALDGRLRDFVLAQPLFFVATAPSDPGGHLNLSPKGLSGSFAVLDDHRVAYLDHTGSGAETAAHLRDDGRIVIMFCAFGGPPNIVRLHGRGRVVQAGQPEFADLLTHFVAVDRGVRAIVEVSVERISDSCGSAVPLMDHVGDRELLLRTNSRKDDRKLLAYRVAKNARSIDGLPALDPELDAIP